MLAKLPQLRWRKPLGRHHGKHQLVAAMATAGAATLILPSEPAALVAFVAMVTGLGIAGWSFLSRTGTLNQAERRAWRLLGIGLILGTAGLVVHGLAWVITSDVATFGPIDLFWLVGYGLGIAGIASLPHAAGSTWKRLRLLLDGIIGAVAIGAILWTVTLRDLTAELGSSPVWERAVGTSYIMLDATLVVVLVTVVIRRSTYRFDVRLVYVGLAVAAQGVGDYGYLRSGLGRTFSESEPVYALHVAAAMMFLLAGLNVSREPTRREYADRSATPMWALIVPYGLAGVLFAGLLTRFPTVGANATDRSLLHATVLLGALVIARQGVTIRENRRSLDDQRADLVASISHELRTPLTSVVGFLDLLDADEFDSAAERREVTSIAADQAAHLSRMVADLLVLASDNETQIDLHVEPHRTDELLANSVGIAMAAPEQVAITASSRALVFVDKRRIEHAVANIVTNALRYGGDQVEVVASTDAGDLVLEVHDNGPGVQRKYELLIWEKFERGPHRLNSSVPGSGIGLAITRAIASAHGGSTGYRVSERMGGSCFWIRLPGRVQSHVTAAPAVVGPLAIVPADLRTA